VACRRDPSVSSSRRVLVALSALLGCSSGVSAQPTSGKVAAPSERVRYLPLDQVCRGGIEGVCDRDQDCECKRWYVPPRSIAAEDVAAGAEWIVRDGHRVEVEMPTFTKSVFLLGPFAPKGHPSRVRTVAELKQLAAKTGERLHYLWVRDEGEDVLIDKRFRGRLLSVEFGFEPSGGLGAIGECWFALYRRQGRLTITETGGCVVR
jgi:hypothetical protein